MKTRIHFFNPIAMITIAAVLLFSCAKEELIPTAVTTRESPRPSNFAEDQLQAKMPFSNIVNPLSVKVAIRGFDCPDKGQSLLVYSPDSPDLNYFNSRDFTVRWYINGCPASDGIRLDCTCRGRYFAMVLHNATQQLVGIAFYAIEEECDVNDDGTVN